MFWFVIVVPKYLNFASFAKFVSCLYVMDSPCFLVTRPEHILSFLRFSSRSISLLASIKIFYGTYIMIQ
jgi:hypothetical protein